MVLQNGVLDSVSKWCWSFQSWKLATLGGSDRYVEVSAAEQRSPPGFYPQMPQLTLHHHHQNRDHQNCDHQNRHHQNRHHQNCSIKMSSLSSISSLPFHSIQPRRHQNKNI